MEWAAVEEAVAARLFASTTSLESKFGSPSFGTVLFTYFLEYQTSDFKSTKPRRNAFLDFIQSGDAHSYVIFAVTLFWLTLKHISIYHVFICVSLVTACLFIFVNHLAFLLLENGIKWISRESRLLCAILKDGQGFKDLSDQIRSEAPEVWDSELGSDQIRSKALEVRDSELGSDQSSDFKSTKPRSHAFLDFIQSGDAHSYLIFAVTLFWLNLKRISPCHVFICVSLVTACLFIFVNYLKFLLLENDIKWISRESRLLCAILEDAQGIKDLSDQIRSKAPEVRDSELGSDQKRSKDSGVVNVGLNESEVAWVDKTDSELDSGVVNVGPNESEVAWVDKTDSELDSGMVTDSELDSGVVNVGPNESEVAWVDKTDSELDLGVENVGPNEADSELDLGVENVGPNEADSELDLGVENVGPNEADSELDLGVEDSELDLGVENVGPNDAWVDKTGVVNVGLNESEVAWVDKTRIVVEEAKKLVEGFQSKRKSGKILRIMSLSMLDLTDVEDLFKRTKQVKDAMNDSIMMKNVREIDVCDVRKVRICESLEKSWSTVRKLLDRPIEEQENKWIRSILQVDGGGCVSSLAKKVKSMKDLIDDIKKLDSVRDRLPLYLEIIELQLTLLHPFLQHVKELRLESAIGKAWLKEVDEIAGEVQLSLDAFSNATAYQVWWLGVPRIIKVWKAWRKLEAATRRIDVSFSELFQRKERYGFKFIIRDSSKSSKYHNEDGKEKVLSVVKDIRNFLDQTRVKLGRVSSKLKSLCDQLANMCTLLDDAEATHAGINSLREAWFGQMEDVAKIAAESKKAFWKNFTSGDGSYHIKNFTFGSTGAGLQLSREIDQIKHRIHVIERSIRAYSIELREESSSVVGLEEDVDSLVSQLTAESSHQDCSCEVLSIVGMEGIGKTTLAKKVYSHSAIQNGFPIRVWINVPKQCEGVSFLEDVGKQIPGCHNPSLQEKAIKSEEEECWKMMVSDFLNKDKYFLVLDNVSTKEAWDTLVKLMVLKTSKGCRVLLTTREEEVASLADRYSGKKLSRGIRLRTKDESLNLLKQMVHISTGEEKIAEYIASKCLGLPLSVIRVGYMVLKLGLTASEALLKAPLLKSAFRKSDKDLELLEHFELFPRDFEIPARRLITLWVSEGLVKKSGDENQTLEQVAEERLFKLIDQGIVQAVKRKANGKVKTCCLPITPEPTSLQFSHDSAPEIQHVKSFQRLAHHFDCKSHQTVCLIHSSSTHDLPDNTKLHSFCYDSREDDEPREGIRFPPHIEKKLHDLHSFLSFDPREVTGEEIGNFLRWGIERGYLQGLHVLDLERVFRPELPKDIGKLKKLRYLGLRWTYLQSIPSSIGELVHLETLDLKHTYVHALPSSLWKLQRLRHLYLDQSNRSKFMQHPSGSFLKSLETLWGVFVDKNSPLKDCLDKMTNLRKLGLAFQLDMPEQSRITDRIMKLKHLQSLRLRSIDKTSKPGKLSLKLSGLENLSSLDLFGILENPSAIDEFPKQLTELTLSACGLSEDAMCKLGKLLNLKLLCFYSNSYSGEQMTFPDEDFPKLLVLKLWKLEKLKKLVFQEKALRNLRELEVRSCNSLEVPYELKNLKALLELKLTNMPEEFVREIDNSKGKIWNDTTHSPSIKIIDGF